MPVKRKLSLLTKKKVYEKMSKKEKNLYEIRTLHQQQFRV